MTKSEQFGSKSSKFLPFDGIAAVCLDFMYSSDCFANSVTQRAINVNTLKVDPVIALLKHGDDGDLNGVNGKTQECK